VQWGRRATCVLETARAARRSRSRGRYSWGEERIACAHGELGRDIRVQVPGQMQLCSELVVAPRRTRSKTRIGFVKLRITLGPMIASWRRIGRLFWTHSGLVFPRPQLLFSRALAANFHCRRDRFARAAVRGGLFRDRCDCLLTEKGAATALRRRQSVHRFSREAPKRSKGGRYNNTSATRALVAPPRNPLTPRAAEPSPKEARRAAPEKNAKNHG